MTTLIKIFYQVSEAKLKLFPAASTVMPSAEKENIIPLKRCCRFEHRLYAPQKTERAMIKRHKTYSKKEYQRNGRYRPSDLVKGAVFFLL